MRKASQNPTLYCAGNVKCQLLGRALQIASRPQAYRCIAGGETEERSNIDCPIKDEEIPKGGHFDQFRYSQALIEHCLPLNRDLRRQDDLAQKDVSMNKRTSADSMHHTYSLSALEDLDSATLDR